MKQHEFTEANLANGLSADYMCGCPKGELLGPCEHASDNVYRKPVVTEPGTARVKSTPIYATDVKEGNVIVPQDALIREDGSHILRVIKVEKGRRFVWLTFEGGSRQRYSRNSRVHLGIKY